MENDKKVENGFLKKETNSGGRYKLWVCTSCGNEVHSTDYPTLHKWSDGHVCHYREQRENHDDK